jgi:hypothetical protein
MAIVGLNFKRMLIERKSSAKGKMNIKNNVSIKNVEKTSLALGKDKQDGLRFEFEFTSDYEPEIGSIVINGDVVDIRDAKVVEETVNAWNKDKKVAPEVMTPILNTVLSKCNIQAIILSKDMSMPPPVPMPKVNTAPEQEAEKAEVKE